MWIANCNIQSLCHSTRNIANIMNAFSNASHHLHLDETIIILGYFSVDMLQNSAITKQLENYMCNYNVCFLLVKIKHV
jgi:hypothetical protein